VNFDPRPICNVLNDAGVAYVVVGGLAATDVDIGDAVVVRVASLDAVIDSKRAADRPKDHRSLPYLESLREQIEQGC
jgi:hypothetical protein